MLTERPGASCKGWWGLWLGVLAEQTGSGTSEARRLPTPPPVPSRESGRGCRKRECRAQGRGAGGGTLHQNPSQKGQLLPNTGPAGLPRPPVPGHPGVSRCSPPGGAQAAGGLRSPKPRGKRCALGRTLPGSQRSGKGCGRSPRRASFCLLRFQRGVSTAAPALGPGLIWSLQIQRIPLGPPPSGRDQSVRPAPSPLVCSCT